MKITLRHPASKNGVPVIVDNRGKLLEYPAGVKELRRRLELSTTALAEKCGVSRRTVEGWEQGRQPEAAALNVMGLLLEDSK